MTERKAVDRLRGQRRRKRGGGNVIGEGQGAGLGQVRDPAPDPALAALMAEECDRLLRRLDDAGLRRLALLKMEGHSNEEIAATMGRALRTVERKLGVILDLWEQEPTP